MHPECPYRDAHGWWPPPESSRLRRQCHTTSAHPLRRRPPWTACARRRRMTHSSRTRPRRRPHPRIGVRTTIRRSGSPTAMNRLRPHRRPRRSADWPHRCSSNASSRPRNRSADPHGCRSTPSTPADTIRRIPCVSKRSATNSCAVRPRSSPIRPRRWTSRRRRCDRWIPDSTCAPASRTRPRPLPIARMTRGRSRPTHRPGTTPRRRSAPASARCPDRPPRHAAPPASRR